jgi:glycerol-3-phosphate acyltransferase PlsY
LGWKGALPVFLFDFLKGFVPVWIALRSGFDFYLPVKALAAIVGLAALLGHVFSVFLGGKGGKGMATGAGFFTALCPPLFPACLAVFLPVLALSRRMSVASISAAVSLPFMYIAILLLSHENAEWYLVTLSFLVPVLIIAKHRKNISRLMEGAEKPLFRKPLKNTE